jgi:hypothetical protein
MSNVTGTVFPQQLLGDPRFTPRQSPAEIPDEMIDPALRSDRGLQQSTSQDAGGQSDDSRESSAMSNDEEGGDQQVDGWGVTNRRETSHPGTLLHVAGFPAHEVCRLFL